MAEHLSTQQSYDLPDPQVGFFELGMDSLMAVDLQVRLSQLLGINLPSTLTFDYPNIVSLEKYLIENHLAHLIPVTPANAAVEKELSALEADLLSEIGQASDEELESSIDQILASY